MVGTEARRKVLRRDATVVLAVMGLVAVVVACTTGYASVVSSPGTTGNAGTALDGATDSTAPAPLTDDVTLTVGTPTGIAIIDPATGTIETSAPTAVSTGDGTRWLTGTTTETGTRVGVFDPASQSELSNTAVDGSWLIRLTSPDGALVALTKSAGAPAGPDLAPPRARTPLLVVRPGSDRAPQLIELEGNYEPEAFSVDHTSLFVMEFTPAMTPERYRVRRLDLATGTVGDVLDRNKAPQGDMPGQARTQVRSPDGAALYTLYTVDAGHGHHEGKHAFVHVLDLESKFAHCIDLPAPFGSGNQEVAALAVTSDGSRLYAVDRAAGAIAAIDTNDLSVTETAPIEAAPMATTVTATVASDERLFVGTDATLTTIDLRNLRETGTRTLSTPATALYQSPRSGRLYAAAGPIIMVFGPDMKMLRTLNLDAVGAVTSIGPGAGPLPAQREAYQCAC